MTDNPWQSASSTEDVDLDADVHELVEEYQRLTSEFCRPGQTPARVRDLDTIRDEVEDRVGTSEAVKLLL